LERLLSRNSGLLGMTGTSDMREIEERAANGDEAARMAMHVFTHRIRKYVGAYASVMGGVDAITFTGGIGEGSAIVRHRVAQRLDYLGAQIDEDRNRDCRVGLSNPVAEFSSSTSRTKLLVVATDEERSLAEQAGRVLNASQQPSGERRVPIAVSARHVHLTQATIAALFGKDHQLTPAKPLSQPGQFAARETVTLIGPKKTIEGVRVLGPPRDRDQVELSRTDEFHLGIDAPVRVSGDLDNTPGITVAGPQGRVNLPNGVICAQRHIHMTLETAQRWGLKDRDIVEVSIDSCNRDIEFRDVIVRATPKSSLEMHIDTDEANASGITTGDSGLVVRKP
jgi:acetate kinase